MRKLLVLILLLVLAAKTGAILLKGPVPIERDAFGYWQMSASVMEGDLLMFQNPIAYRTPVYPWFLAILRLLSGPHTLQVLAVMQGLFSFGSLVIAAFIAKRITKLPKALPLTLLVGIPAVSSLVYDAAVLSESLFVFVFMMNLLAIMDYAKYGTATRAAWVGATFAITLLTRPIVLLLWIPHLFFLLLIHLRKNGRLRSLMMNTVLFRSRVYHTLLAAVVVAACVSPWLMRNQLLFDRPFLTEFIGRNIWVVTFKDGSGANLEIPSSKPAQELVKRLDQVEHVDLATVFGSGYNGPDDRWRDTWHVSNNLVRSGLNDADADQLMKQVAVEAAQKDSRFFAFKAFRRVVNYWRCAATDLPPQGLSTGPFHGQYTWQYSVPSVDWALKYRLSQSVMLNTLLLSGLAFSVVLLIVNYPTRPYGIWIASILTYFSLVTGILEIPDYRYRIVLEPLVALTFGSALAVLMSRHRKVAEITSSQASRRTSDPSELLT